MTLGSTISSAPIAQTPDQTAAPGPAQEGGADIAIIIPIFRHSALLVEAIESALAQDGQGPRVRIVLVNDGCPNAETDAVCRDYALCEPDRITYLRKPNGGLSDARNHGVRFALGRWPELRALFMLDADNRLRPGAMKRAFSALCAAPEAGWVYPSIDMFGLDRACDFGGRYSRLVHGRINICEAGSLINRAVFDAGIFFDTDFELGFEDWDFFLSAAARGFRGINLENLGLMYRKRPESMLADAARDAALIRGQLKQKHADFYALKSQIALEHHELPRYAIWLLDDDTDELRLVTDPAAPGATVVDHAEFAAQVWRAQASAHHSRPAFLVTLRRAVFDLLLDQGLLHSALWTLENAQRGQDAAVLALRKGPDGRLGMTVAPASPEMRQSADVALLGPQALEDLLTRPGTLRLDSLLEPLCDLPVAGVTVTLPAKDLDGVLPGTAAQALHRWIMSLRKSRFRAAGLKTWDWRLPDMRLRPDDHEILREAFGGAPVFPRIADGQKHIGLVLPMVEFGGVEKVALNIARALRRAGWQTHVFVLEASEGAIDDDWRAAVASVTFLNDDAFETWAPGEQTYMGTPIPRWAQSGDHGQALAMLSWLDAVINFHGGALCGAIGALRRMGVTTLTSLHVSDFTDLGLPWGNTYLSLAYEYAYDHILTCSHSLADWCAAMGVPQAKIIAVPNAPSFALEARTLEDGIKARAARDPGAPLRLLYLGRLDPQKGMDRLARLAKATEDTGLNVAWRFIGKPVLGPEALPERIAKSLEPPVGPAGLAQAYDWADVVVLMSDYEGLPLTILEAMRQGAVVIATDVGANGEVITSGENGFLVELAAAAEEGLHCLQTLEKDRSLLAKMSARARLSMGRRNWESACAALLTALGETHDAPHLGRSRTKGA